MILKDINLKNGSRGTNWYKLSGVYMISCMINSKVYVGSSVNIAKRINTHKNELIKGTHHSIALQSAIKKYGIQNFIVSILQTCTPSELQNTEQKFIDYYQSYKRHKGYNIVIQAYVGNIGYNHTNESKQKISESSKLMWVNNREKLIKALKNRDITPETRAKISLSKQKFNYDFDYLNDLYNGLNLKKKDIAELLNVTERKVKDNFKRLGLVKSKENFNKLMDRVRTEYPNHRKGIKDSEDNLVKRSKAVIQMDSQGRFVKEFYGAKNAENILGIPQSNISEVCRGKRKSAGGFKWKFKKL